MVVEKAKTLVAKTTTKTITHSIKFSQEFKKQATIAIMAAFGFLIALVWRDLIQQNSEQLLTFFGLEKGSLFNDFLIAIIITAIAIIGITIISAFKPSEAEKEIEKEVKETRK